MKLYAHQTLAGLNNKYVCWTRWVAVTMVELMQFFGILLKMVVRPTPGQCQHFDASEDSDWHPYRIYAVALLPTDSSHVSFNDNVCMTRSGDKLYKVHPIFSILKATLGICMKAGRELALDEASIACQSRCGHKLIFYNKTKPSGKLPVLRLMLCFDICMSTDWNAYKGC